MTAHGAKVHPVEVYEWRKGDPRPGTVHRARNECIDIVEVPPKGQAPHVGDVVALPDPTGAEPLLYYRVVARELGWCRTSSENAQDPARYMKMKLHVRRLSDEEYAAEP
jgi:hypothetical protein